jgi:hypothetical protein
MWWGSGDWWIVPAIGVALCLALMLTMAYFCVTRGCGCMRGR